ncbi:MAG TPA: DUF5676 family membrane protein [Flavobacteriales bacterium]|jgi:hypothetical protein|nr:hypothetical protein [Flavobacteriales bacterium]HQW05435.1 DUF5676 family membrane protein [Flavobacteriales bacterium]HQW98548.1 DUF5676 family membrane protein [Flavobacteriales bacterium]HQX99413.1 DUF5676 family membrane protein [Flavobacteriales bacterium]
MQRLNIKQAGLAFGATGAALYLGCMLLMATSGSEAIETLFNALLHGLDVHTILRDEVPIEDSVIGLILTFLIGWSAGIFYAWVYNMGVPKPSGRIDRNTM